MSRGMTGPGRVPVGALALRAEPVAGARAELGESPLWDAEVGLRWVDVPGRRLLTLGHDGGESAAELPRVVTAVERGPGGDLLAVTATGFAMLDPVSGRVDPIAEALDDGRSAMNDGGIDPRGRAWAGSAVRDVTATGALFRLAGRQVTEHIPGIGMSNGIDWSPDGAVLYHVDSAAGTLRAWEYDAAAGEIGAAQVLFSLPEWDGLPDGLTVDAAGGVWLAVWGAGRVLRLDPGDGRVTAVAEVPTPYTTSCAFGGPELSTLYITTANHESPAGGGLLYAVDTPFTGLPARRFAGSAR
jgi:sugar lactone lactonase YvrE